MSKELHIVSFAVPYPADYGGVIEVFEKIRALHRAGVKVHLHAFSYDGRSHHPVLDRYCASVHLYPRAMDWRKAAGTTPFIIASRRSESLILRLQEDEHPILLEGMHTGAVLGDKRISGRRILLRMHNIEWEYYRQLATQERSWFKKAYLNAEAWKLQRRREFLHRADKLLAISTREKEILMEEYPQTELLPAFHGHRAVAVPEGVGDFALYHGNLSVPENQKAVQWLAEEVLSSANIPLVVAGKSPPKDWPGRWKNIRLVPDPSEEDLNELIKQAQVHLLPTFQSTGVKLKLLHALFEGRHCLVNSRMTDGSGLETLCHIADDAAGMRDRLQQLMPIAVSEGEKERRKKVLNERYNDDVNALKLLQWSHPAPG